MKGRTNQPLTIAVPHEWLELPHIQALAKQGHTLVPQDWRTFDLVLAPQAHQMNEMLLDYLPAAITAARKRKKGAKN